MMGITHYSIEKVTHLVVCFGLFAHRSVKSVEQELLDVNNLELNREYKFERFCFISY